MKSEMAFLATVLLMSATLHAQKAPPTPIVKIDRPTIVAFFPRAATTHSNDADANEALSDFEVYVERLKKPMSQRGIQFSEQLGPSFRIRLGTEIKLFTPKAETPGYYFIAPGKKPHLEYGVATDVDLIAMAEAYFGATPDKSTSPQPGKSLPAVFDSVLAEIKSKSQIAILLPTELANPIKDVQNAVVEKVSEGEYAVALYSELGIGDAGFAALFAAEVSPGFEAQALPNVLKVQLSKGISGYFRPVSCGGSCAPANLWWMEDRVLYQIQLELPPTIQLRGQERTLISMANSAILAGPR